MLRHQTPVLTMTAVDKAQGRENGFVFLDLVTPRGGSTHWVSPRMSEECVWLYHEPKSLHHLHGLLTLDKRVLMKFWTAHQKNASRLRRSLKYLHLPKGDIGSSTKIYYGCVDFTRIESNVENVHGTLVDRCITLIWQVENH